MSVIEKVKKVAQSNKDGFTFDLRAERMVVDGIVAAYHATQNSFGFECLPTVVAHAQANAGVVGGWFNTEDARFYFDSVRIFTDLSEAIAFGMSEDQIAIFDLTNLKEIRLK